MERLDLTFVNYSTTNKIQIELFNALTSWAYQYTRDQRQLNTINWDLIPFGVYPPPIDVVKLGGNIIFDQYGGLNILENVTGNPVCLIYCDQYPYKAILEAMKTMKIMIKRILISSDTQTQQLTQSIIRFERKPLTFDFKEEFYNVTLAPTNVQPLLNEYKQDLLIDNSSGLYYVILPNSVCKWTIEYENI